MKQKLLNNFKLRATLLVALLCTAFTGAWADDAYYTLDTTGGTQTNNNGYATTGTVTVDGIGWSFNGNGQINPWRLGGKSLTEVDRAAYTTTAMGAAINRIELTVGAASGITVNSLTLIVASDASFGTVLDEVEEDFEASSTITFEPTSGSSWATGSYYKFVFNVTVSGSSNKFVQFSKVEFYEYTGGGGGSSAVATTTAIDASGITNTNIYAGTEAGTLSATVSAGETIINNATITWSGNNDAVATIDASTGAVTLVAAGSVTFTATYAGVENTYNPSSKTYVMTVTSSDPNGPGTENNPYTVAEARAAIDAGTGVTGVYATGVVTEIVTAYGTNNYNNVTFNIVDQEGDEDFLQAYRCVGDDAPNVSVGDIVVVSGNLTKYKTTYEFAQGCEVVSLQHPVITTPYFTAENVNIEYNASAGEIAYTVENPVNGGSVTASTTSDWLTLGSVFTSPIAFTCDANTAAAARTATVTLTYTYGNDETVTKDVTVTQAGNPDVVNNISDITEVGTTYTVRGTVVATNSRGFVIGDGTGYVYYYKNAAPTQTVGEIVSISGTTGTYGQIIQFTSSATVAEATVSSYNGNPQPTTITEVPDYSTGYHLSTYLEFEGTLTKSSSNYLVTIGESQIQISYPTTDQGTALTALVDKTVRVHGFFSGINSSSKFTVMLESVEEVATPTITITPDTYNMDAKAGGGELPVVCANLATDPQLEVVFVEADGVTPANYDWISATINANGNIDGQIEANTGDARTAYFYVKGVDDDNNTVKSNLVTFTQEAAITEPYITVKTGVWNFDADGGSHTFSFDYGNLGSNPTFEVRFFESDGVTETQCGWIDYQFDANDNKVTITSLANNEVVARTAYFKVWALDDNQQEVFSDLITITQAGVATDYLFSWSGGANADLLALDGVTAYGLGSDYGDSHNPYMVKFDGTGDYIQVKTDSQPGVVSVGVKMIGGANTSTITVQESTDGENFTDVEELTISGKQNDVLELATTNVFAEDSRYVRLLFTKGSNVGVGPISISIPSNEPSITLPQYEYGVNADGGDAELPLTCKNLADEPQLTVMFFEADGTTPAQYDWISASINGNGNIAGHMEPNTGDARTAYFKVSGVDANNNTVYSELVTISQGAYTGPSITTSKSSLDFDAGSGERTLSIEYTGLGSNPSFDVQFFESDETTPTTCDWITSSFATNDNKVTITVAANTGDARTAYFKVYAVVNETTIYSDLVTVNQDAPAAPVVDYATLPFSFNGGKGDIESQTGLTHTGLGTDYSDKTAPTTRLKFDSANDELVLKLNEAPTMLTFDIKGNGFSGGTFTVQTSSDGEKYSDLETYTDLGDTQSESFNLDENVRYIKWIYTNKVNGNVGLGNIIVTAPITVTLNAYGYATFASEFALDFVDVEPAGFSAWAVSEISGETINFTQVTDQVEAGTGVLLKGEAGAIVTINRVASGMPVENLLVGITEETPVEADQYYGLKGDQFQKVNAGTIPAGKALLPASALTAGVKAFTFIFNDADGIQTVQTVSAEAAQAVFNLAGQRLPKAQKGINIINGKKVLVK